MRSAFFLGFLLTACGTDTFSSGDGSTTTDASTDGVTIGDSPAGMDVRTDGPTGCQWCPQMSPTNHDLLGVSGRSQTDVAIVGNNTAQWWNGGGWSTITLGGLGSNTYGLRAVSVLDPQNIWAVGSDGSNGLAMGGTSMALGLPMNPLNPKPSAYNAVARLALIGMMAGTQGTGTFAWSTSGTWNYGDGTTSYFGIDGEGVASGIAVGSGKIALFNGNVWSEMQLGGTHYAVAGNANSGWIVGAGGEIIRYTNGGNFTSISSPTQEDLHGVRARYPSGDVYAVGRNGTIVYLKGGTTTAVIQPSGTSNDLNAIWGDPNGLWAVGNAGTILRHP
jgi:hypothetical protein